jgi:ABC-type branched-subunit amino acid transport system substrate-binding protein
MTPLPVPAPRSAAPASTPSPLIPLAPNAKIKVAILLPLSGKNEGLGQAMLNAAQLAVFDVGDSHFELVPKDTGAGDDSAANAAQDAIKFGAKFLIGPVFASNVAAVKPVAGQANVNMLALSTDTTLAGDGVYVMGFAPGAQVERVVAYAHAHGLHRFAGLIPESGYGDLVGDAFARAVARGSDTMVDLERYSPERHDRDDKIKALVAQADHIDALFLPEGGDDLDAITAQLAIDGFDNRKIKLLGTGLWDVDDLGSGAAFLAGGWYAASDPRARQNFVASYRRTYGEDPPRLVTLAYDATALAAVLVKHGGNFDRAALVNPNGFVGVDGIFRLTDQGLVERSLAIDEVTTSGGRMIDPAASTFVGKPY